MKTFSEYEKEAVAKLKKKVIGYAVNMIALAMVFSFMWYQLGFFQALSIYIAVIVIVAVHESREDKI